MANSKRSKPAGVRRPNSRDPITPGGAGFRFSEVNLNSDPSDNEETINPNPIQRANPANPGNPGMAGMNVNRPGAASTAAVNAGGRPAGIGGLKPLSTGATVQASSIQAAQTKSKGTNIQSQPSQATQTSQAATMKGSPQATEVRSTGGFLPRSAMPPNRQQPAGIAMEQKSADLESIGYAMKSQNTRIQEAEQKYGTPSTGKPGVQQSPTVGPTSSSGLSGFGAQKPARFSYANPPPPELRPKETLPTVNRTSAQPQDLEANKPESSGKGKKVFLFILIGLLVAGLIAGAVVAIVMANKAPPKK